MGWTADAVNAILASLDRKEPNLVTWAEVMSYLEKEGQRREMRHDSGLFDRGVTRLVEDGETVRLGAASKTEYNVDLLLEVKGGLLFTVFENGIAHFLDPKTFDVVSEFDFKDRFKIKPVQE